MLRYYYHSFPVPSLTFHSQAGWGPRWNPSAARHTQGVSGHRGQVRGGRGHRGGLRPSASSTESPGVPASL